MIQRRRFEQAFTLKDRLAQEIEQLRDQAKNMKPGVALDQVLRRIQQRETASDINDSLGSPALRAPT
jgi:hypothetical protein